MVCVSLLTVIITLAQGRRNRGGARGALGGGAEVKVGGLAPPENLVFSGKILIIEEIFRLFVENLGIRGKICNTLFNKNSVFPEKNFVICREKIFSSLFLYVCGKIFVPLKWYTDRKGGGHGKNFFSPPRMKSVPPPLLSLISLLSSVDLNKKNIGKVKRGLC